MEIRIVFQCLKEVFNSKSTGNGFILIQTGLIQARRRVTALGSNPFATQHIIIRLNAR